MILEPPPQIKSVTVSILSPSICMKEWDRMPWSEFFECWALSQLFHSPLSLLSWSSLVPHHFLPLWWCHLHIWGYWYFSRNFNSSLSFIQPCISSDVLCILINKQGGNIQPWCTPFPILNQSVVPCLVLTVASWPAYRFLRRHIRWSDIPISLRIFHSLLWFTQSKTLV